MGEKSQDYIEAVLTDEESLADPLGELRQIYPNLMRLTFDNRRTQTQGGPGRCPKHPGEEPFGAVWRIL